MSNNKDVGKTRLQEFYTALLPYLAKWGHVIKNASGTGMNGRNALKFAGDTAVADDETNDQTVITPHELSNAEIADIMATLPLNPSSTYIPNTGFTPVGTVISIMSNHAPANYLACDGTVYNIAQYPVLAKHFKDEFGSENFFGGDGTTILTVSLLLKAYWSFILLTFIRFKNRRAFIIFHRIMIIC